MKSFTVSSTIKQEVLLPLIREEHPEVPDHCTIVVSPGSRWKHDGVMVQYSRIVAEWQNPPRHQPDREAAGRLANALRKEKEE